VVEGIDVVNKIKQDYGAGEGGLRGESVLGEVFSKFYSQESKMK